MRAALVQGVKALAYLLPDLLRALVQRPETGQFPFAPPQIPEGYRGRVQAHPERCRGCGLCVRDCPAFALELHRENRDTFRLVYYPARCAFCGQCEISCPFGVLYQTHTFVRGTEDLDRLTVTLVDRSASTTPEES